MGKIAVTAQLWYPTLRKQNKASVMKPSLSRISAATALALAFLLSPIGWTAEDAPQEPRATITLADIARASAEDAAIYILGALTYLKQEFDERGHDSIVSCMDGYFFNEDGMSGTFDLYSALYQQAHEGDGSADAMRFIMGYVRDACVTPNR